MGCVPARFACVVWCFTVVAALGSVAASGQDRLAILPNSLQPVPDQLWLVETGFMHVRPLADGATAGGTFLFGSASDRPYAAGRDLTLMAIAFYNRPAKNERDEWNFSLFYSPTSQLPYPLAGLAYVWRPDATFEAKIGVPAAIEYRPDDDWTFTANYFPLVNFAATARRRLSERLSFLAYYRTDVVAFDPGLGLSLQLLWRR